MEIQIETFSGEPVTTDKSFTYGEKINSPFYYSTPFNVVKPIPKYVQSNIKTMQYATEDLTYA